MQTRLLCLLAVLTLGSTGTVPGAVFSPPPAGASGTGRLTVSGLSVAATASVTIQFEVTVSSSALNGAVLQNCMSFTVAEKPSEGAYVSGRMLVGG